MTESVFIQPAITSHQRKLIKRAVQSIREELLERVAYFESQNLLIEAQRIEQRTMFDLEMIKEVGYCQGIENYSRHLTNRTPNDPPPTLLDYFPDDSLFIIDESHATIPQLNGMYRGDRSRKRKTNPIRVPTSFPHLTTGRLNSMNLTRMLGN